MPYLKTIDGEVVEWGLTYDTLRFTYRNAGFPYAVPDGWSLDFPELTGANVNWVFYTDIQDVSGNAALKFETVPVLGIDGRYHSSYVDPTSSSKIYFYFDTTVLNEGNKVDIQSIRVNLTKPLDIETIFYISIADGKVAPNSSIYPHTWIEGVVDSITVAAGETFFEVPVLVKGNTFFNTRERKFDLTISTENPDIVSGNGFVLRDPAFSLWMMTLEAEP